MSNEVIVQKLIGYIEKIMNYCISKDYNSFIADTKLVEACVFNLSQMGELVNKLDEAFTAAHREIPWRSIYGLRNRIVHDYEGVNLTLVWEIIAEDLSILRTQLMMLLSK